MRVSVDSAALSRGLREAIRRAQNMREAWDEIGELVLTSVRRNFDEGGRPPWPARATQYSGKRRGNKLLIDTARLMNSMTRRSGTTYAEVGTNVVYAATHQFGRGGIPARPFLAVQDDDQVAIGIPARPFLAVQDDDQVAIDRVLSDYLVRPLL